MEEARPTGRPDVVGSRPLARGELSRFLPRPPLSSFLRLLATHLNITACPRRPPGHAACPLLARMAPPKETLPWTQGRRRFLLTLLAGISLPGLGLGVVADWWWRRAIAPVPNAVARTARRPEDAASRPAANAPGPELRRRPIGRSFPKGRGCSSRMWATESSRTGASASSARGSTSSSALTPKPWPSAGARSGFEWSAR